MAGDETWVERCLDELEGLGFTHASARARPEADSIHDLVLSDGDRSWKFRTECVRHMRPSTVSYRIGSLRSGETGDAAAHPWLLFSERISESVGRSLRDQDVCYVDASGNAWIQQPGLRVWVEGRPPKRAQRVKPKMTTPTALQVVYLLLKEPVWCERPYREVAERTGLALGTIGWIMSAMMDSGWVRGLRSRRELTNPRELCAHWEQNWHERLRPRLEPRLCKGRPDPGYESLLERCAGESDWLVGGELAATKVVEGLEAASVTVHVPRGGVRACLEKLKLLPHPEGDVHVLETFGQDNGWAQDTAKRLDDGARLADPLLIRAELLGSRDERVHSLADELFERYVVPRWGG